MSAKNPQTGQAAQQGAQQGFNNDPSPPQQQEAVQQCDAKHWVAVRVIDEDGKPVAGVKVKIVTPAGTTLDVNVDKKGKYQTAKNLPPGNCDISFPDLFDLEWKPQ